MPDVSNIVIISTPKVYLFDRLQSKSGATWRQSDNFSNLHSGCALAVLQMWCMYYQRFTG